MTTLEHILNMHDTLCKNARDVVEVKGKDYNRGMQDVDTLFNISLCKTIGITDTVTAGILVRLCDKFMRLISLTKNPNEVPAVKNESVRDTVEDSINYLVYLYCKYMEERNA